MIYLRIKIFLYNSVASGALQITTIIGGLILPRLYITTYGSEINGLVTSINQLVTYFGYVEAGLGSALIYALYKPLVQKNINQINSIVSLAKKSYIRASGIYVLLVIGMSVLYPLIVKSEGTDTVTIMLLVIVIGSFGALEFYTMAKYRVLFVADQKEYVIHITLLLAYIVNFSLTVFLIQHKAYIVLVRTIPLVSFVIRALLLYIYFKRKYPYVTYKNYLDLNTNHLKRRWDALLMQISLSVNISAPIVIISVFCSLKIASVYAVYDLVFSGLIAIISIFTAGISASFGNLLANKETQTLKNAHSQFEFGIYAISAFLHACALILINPFISIYTNGVNDINYVNPLYGILFVVWGILFNVRIPYTALINAGGLYSEARKVNVLVIVILLVSAFILVQHFQMAGVLTAKIISTLFWVFGLMLVVKRGLLKVSPIRTILLVIRKFVIIIIAYLPFKLFIHISATTMYEWFVWAVGAGVWCGFVTLSVNYFWDQRLFRDSFARIKFLFLLTNNKEVVKR